MTLGKGKAVAISDADIASLANTLRCHPADLEAIAEVESNGFGWFPDGRIKILFEKHWFYKLLPEAKRAAAVKAGLARKSWVSPAKGGYKDQSDADSRYRLLERAIALDPDAAYQSISIGTYQIMGFNHALCGHQTAKQMFDAFCESEAYQLSALAGFLLKKGLDKALSEGDFARIEQVYNGGGLNGTYAAKMRAASKRLRAGKWADWSPSRSIPKPPIPPKPTTPASEPAEGIGRGVAAIVILVLTAISAAVVGGWQWIVSLFQ